MFSLTYFQAQLLTCAPPTIITMTAAAAVAAILANADDDDVADDNDDVVDVKLFCIDILAVFLGTLRKQMLCARTA